jgi:hypothetical protein
MTTEDEESQAESLLPGDTADVMEAGPEVVLKDNGPALQD